MHDAKYLLATARDGCYCLYPVRGASGQPIPLPLQARVVAVREFCENRVLLLAAVCREVRLYLFNPIELRAPCLWRQVGHPCRHGLAVGFGNQVWITTSDTIVELRNWRQFAVHVCPGPGPLSVNRGGCLVVACTTGDGLRDCLAVLRNGDLRVVEYRHLFDVCCVQCLQDGLLVVADHGLVYNQCAIKLVDPAREVVLRTIMTVPISNPWTGLSVSSGADGLLTLSDVKDRGLIVTQDVISPCVTACVFYPSSTFLLLWPEKRDVASLIVHCFHRLGHVLPKELILHILFLLFV